MVKNLRNMPDFVCSRRIGAAQDEVMVVTSFETEAKSADLFQRDYADRRPNGRTCSNSMSAGFQSGLK